MVKCSKCGSTAQLKVIDRELKDLDNDYILYTTYKCGCGHLFLTSTVYSVSEEEKIFDDNI